jgi:hypothetical protein
MIVYVVEQRRRLLWALGDMLAQNHMAVAVSLEPLAVMCNEQEARYHGWPERSGCNIYAQQVPLWTLALSMHFGCLLLGKPLDDKDTVYPCGGGRKFSKKQN